MPEPFNAEDVIRICTAIKENPCFQNWDNITRNRHDLLHGKIDVDIPGIAQKLEDKSPALKYHRTQYDNALHGADLTVNVAARSSKHPAIEAAQRAENFYYTVYRDMMRSYTADAERASIDQMVCYGVGVPRLTYSADAEKAMFKKGQKLDTTEEIRAALGDVLHKNPFALETPALSAVFWEPNRKTFCEVGEKAVSELVLAYPDNEKLRKWTTSSTMPEHNTDWQRRVKVYHLETEEYIYDLVDELDELHHRSNIIGRPWYALMPGHENSEIAVAERFEPLIGPLYDVVNLMNITGTLMMSGAVGTGRNTLQLVDDGKKGAQDYMTWINMPSNERPVLVGLSVDEAVVTPPAGKHYESMPVPDQEQLINAHKLLESRLDRWGFPAALATDLPLEGGAASGYQLSRQMEAAARFLEPALRNRAKAWQEHFLAMGDALRELKLKVEMPLYRRAQGESTNIRHLTTVLPTDFQEFDLEVLFKSTPASVERALIESDLRLVELKLMSVDTFFNRHYDNALEEKEKLRLEALIGPIDQMALEDALQIIQVSRGQLMEEATTEAKIPLAPSPAGGPAPGQTIRRERPEGAAGGGLGAPETPPPQAQAGTPPGPGSEIAVGV